MNKIIARLVQQFKAEERRVAFYDRALDERRHAGDGKADRGGQASKRSYALKRMADLSIAIEALRAVQNKPVPRVGG